MTATDKEKISELCYELDRLRGLVKSWKQLFYNESCVANRLRDENTSFLKTLTDIELSKISHDESEYRAWLTNED